MAAPSHLFCTKGPHEANFGCILVGLKTWNLKAWFLSPRQCDSPGKSWLPASLKILWAWTSSRAWSYVRYMCVYMYIYIYICLLTEHDPSRSHSKLLSHWYHFFTSTRPPSFASASVQRQRARTATPSPWSWASFEGAQNRVLWVDQNRPQILRRNWGPHLLASTE